MARFLCRKTPKRAGRFGIIHSMANQPNQAWRSWLMIALVAAAFFSMYRMNPNPPRTRDITLLEFYQAMEQGQLVEPVTRVVDRDEGETYRYNAAYAYYQDKDLEQAAETLRPLLDSKKNGAKAGEFLGRVRMEQAKKAGAEEPDKKCEALEEAATAFQRALRDLPEDERRNRNLTRAVFPLPEARETAHIAKVMKEKGQTPPDQLAASLLNGQRAIMRDGQGVFTNAAPAMIASSEALAKRQAELAKPPGSLGRLEDISIRLAGYLSVGTTTLSEGLARKEDTFLATPFSGDELTPADRAEYRCGTVTELSLSLPEDPASTFACALVFDTPEGNGSAALDYPEGIRWSGDDLVDGEFLLFGERHYTVFLWYDGSWEATVRGVDL